MGVEIERKFLIKNDSWKSSADNGVQIKQGYLNSDKNRTVRVRVYGETGFLTIKGKNENLTRQEFEYEIPLDDANNLLELCEMPIIEKMRYIIVDQGNNWELDVFEGENKGLLVAEIELNSEDHQLELPAWVGEEVSTDPKYYNSSLISNPYKNWDV
ncbi:CYTH domain-containing protein [Chondrinema litorale]|uniref:CYTH domain-containing protein n=1 Tax=Chondrinema litorale TaxID=2994555 RepID=UPI002543ECD3|nr:CYTH domain-containing protein [Chondrinema litorale]UZR99541.1 CYTH domain-containing protein [Chondrinema litorale]